MRGLGAILAIGSASLALYAYAWKQNRDADVGEDGFVRRAKGLILGIAHPMTDILSPAPIDVNEEPSGDSRIVGKATSNPKASAETNRIINLARRWKRVRASGHFSDPMHYENEWLDFGVKRSMRSLAGWEKQFRQLETVEDTAEDRSKGHWRPIREDWSIYSDAVYDGKVKEWESNNVV